MPLYANGDLKFAAISAAADGVNVIVAPVALKKIRVIAYHFSVNVTGTITVQDSTGTPVVLAKFALLANTFTNYQGGPNMPAFDTSVGKGLDVSNPAGVDTFGHVVYMEID